MPVSQFIKKKDNITINIVCIKSTQISIKLFFFILYLFSQMQIFFIFPFLINVFYVRYWIENYLLCSWTEFSGNFQKLPFVSGPLPRPSSIMHVPFLTAVYSSVQQCTAVYISVQKCTAMYISVQKCTVVYSSVQCTVYSVQCKVHSVCTFTVWFCNIYFNRYCTSVYNTLYCTSCEYLVNK